LLSCRDSENIIWEIKENKCLWAEESFLSINTLLCCQGLWEGYPSASVSNSVANISRLLYLPQAQPSLTAASSPPASSALVSQPWKLHFSDHLFNYRSK